MENWIGKILAGMIAMIMSLVAVIYNNMSQRLKRVEKMTDDIYPAVIEIKGDVKHIKKNCLLCGEEGTQDNV